MTQLPQTTPVSPKLPPRRSWAGRSWFQGVQEVAVPPLIFLCACVTVLTTLGIIAVLGVETVRFFRASGVGLVEFLAGPSLNPKADPPRYGILPLFWGTFVIAFGSSLIALPVGLLSAIFLSEYAPRGLRSVLKPTLELLAGIPTIVYGYLALLLVTPVLKAVLEPAIRVEFYNALSGCVVVGIMIIPMVSSLSEDVLSAVPRGLREAAYGLGATKFEVATRVVLPAGLSGVIASFILAISRAVGETMAVLLAVGVKPQITLNPLRSMETMTAYIVNVMKGEAAVGSAEHLSLYAVGMALFVITLVMNIISGIILKHFREEYD
ncbi:phosphate ABC transporter permease subunit PstC [Tautonia plasticadhaerens]|uniref:Phosphate transport system permease protein n=1 Tax=Tautonia plasticadhaerens TaxID=2527974 RepID=A0A518HBM3_9BACT|nr:phosphate ABC transporter permease subunit PstC [Tautonia plasticadhaerens]QDV38251.1 Phosphate transport system permease protein PstC [Tautonia plasticadhaerens]